MVLQCGKQWSNEYSYTRRPDSGRPRSTQSSRSTQFKDNSDVRTASKTQNRPNVVTGVSTWTNGNRLFVVRLRTRVTLVRLPLRHNTIVYVFCGVAKASIRRPNVVLNDESRFCLHASDCHLRVLRESGKQHLSVCIRPQNTDKIINSHISCCL